MFYLMAAIIIVFSIMSVTSRRILRAAVYLLFALLGTAAIYFMMEYFFLAAVQLTLYAGGIVVLIVFSILLTGRIEQKFEPTEARKALATLAAVGVGLGVTLYTILKHPFVGNGQAATEVNMRVIGKTFLNYGEHGYILPFEVISILLLAAMVGAIIIAKKQINN